MDRYQKTIKEMVLEQLEDSLKDGKLINHRVTADFDPVEHETTTEFIIEILTD